MSDNAHAHELDAGSHHGSPMVYVFVWIALLIGTYLTFTIAHGERTPWTLPIALGIATTKATLVILFFMHLYGDKGLPKLILATVAVLLILFIGGVIADLDFRFALAAPYGETVPVPPR